MRQHIFEPASARPVLAITFDDRWFDPHGTYRLCESYFDGVREWRHDGRYQLNRSEPVLIEFSDGSCGVTSEGRLAAALAAYDITLGDD